VGDQYHCLCLAGSNNTLQGSADPVGHLQQGFSARRRYLYGICLPGSQGAGMTLLRLGKGQSFPVTKGYFAQAWLQLHRETQRGRNAVGRLPGPLQITAVQGLYTLRREQARQSPGLALSCRVERHVGLPLETPCCIPSGFSMSY
jgi:hypothetical protein